MKSNYGEVYEPSEHTRRAIGRELTKPLSGLDELDSRDRSGELGRVRSAVSLDDEAQRRRYNIYIL